MKNPFKRNSQVDAQIAKLNEVAALMREAADRVAFETSAPVLKAKLAEIDPRLLDLLIDQSRYELLFGNAELAAGSRMRAVEACRYAFDTDVQLANATKTWTDWGFGRSLAIAAIDPQANVVWQECWDAARNRAVFGQQHIHELSEKLLTDGEFFFIGYASRQDGTTTWRVIDTDVVTEIIHPPNDKTINVWYIVTLDNKQVAIPDAFTYFALRDRFEGVQLPNNVEDINATAGALNNGGTFACIVPVQRNRKKDGRGWPEFYKAIAWSNVYSQMLREYSAVFSAVAMFVDKLKVQGSQRTVDGIIAQLQSSLVTSSVTGETNPRPAAASTWVENDAADRTRLPLGSAAGDAQTGTLTVGTQLATALRVKLSDIGRPDAFQNKATADVAAESPQQAWQRYQLFWSAAWSDVVETTLRLREAFSNPQQRFSDYACEISTTLPMDIEASEITAAMDAVTKAAVAFVLDPGLATRANTALTGLLLLDLGVGDVETILEPEQAEAAIVTVAPLAESHSAVTVAHICPLCGYNEAYSYDGHGGLLVCAGCKKTYDPEVE